MAAVLGAWSTSVDLGALHVSPLQRAQETAAPIAAANNISVTTDDRLIEAANIFEGKPFGIGDGVLRHPSAWKHWWNPWKPSWGEPYVEQINRMLAAVFAANKAAKPIPSINAAAISIAVWIFPEASGWRAIASIAEPPILPIPKPAPITINPAPTIVGICIIYILKIKHSFL
jgi:hypothetical protein